MGIIFFLLVLFANVWVWKIILINQFIALVIIATSWFLYRSLKEGKVNKLLIPLVLILLLLEYKTTITTSLVSLNNQEKITQRLQLNAYPPVSLKIGRRIFYIPMAHWLEERKETLIVYRITQNISEVLSPNLYFFGNHPNERVGIKEFEKFPYILFPFFLLGFLTFDYKKNIKVIMLTFLLPLLLIMFVGDNNTLGPFSFFPLIVVFSVFGIEFIYRWFVKLGYEKVFIIIFFISYFVVLTQTTLYEIF